MLHFTSKSEQKNQVKENKSSSNGKKLVNTMPTRLKPDDCAMNPSIIKIEKESLKLLNMSKLV